MVELVIQGNLMAACQTWYGGEQMSRRRRVAFASYRSNDTVTTYVLESQSAGHSPYISCLASPDHQRHYFVGTDALNALEVMLGVSLSDEQKKALRNKFERHGSQTIRRDHDVDNLFTLIEGNNDIKPRNLHKGVRIYHWERLATFLKDLASKVPAELLPATLPCNTPPGVTVPHLDPQQAYATAAPALQYDQYGNPLTPTSQQMPYLHSSPGAYDSDPYSMQAYTSGQSYSVPAGYSSPTFAPQYMISSPPLMMDMVTSQPTYTVNYAQHPVQAARWDQNGIRYSQ